MDRVQRSGLITLVLLLGVAGFGLLLGSLDPAETTKGEDPTSAVLEPDQLLNVSLVPPDKRRPHVGPEDFVRSSVRHPLRGGDGRDINDPPAASGAGGGASVLDLGDPAPGPRGTLKGPKVRVREGDTLQSIAQRELGASQRWSELAALNGIRDPRQLRIGQELVLPSGKQAVPAGGKSGKASASAKAASGTTPKARSYVVQAGDTPGEISQKMYGTSRHWKKILAANGVSNPNKLQRGQKLVIPVLP